MPKAQNHKGYSCRVNILNYVKVADKWRFAPAQTQNNKLKQDLVLVDGSPERHAEGTYYINGTRTASGVGRVFRTRAQSWSRRGARPLNLTPAKRESK